MRIGRVMWAPEGQGGQTQPGTTQGNSGDNNTQTAGGQGRVFTQAEVNAIVADRETRDRTVALKDLLSELGFEKADDLRALVKAAKERQASEQTEAQKLQAQLEAAQKREGTLTAQLREQALQMAVQAAAQKLGIVDAEVALALVRGNIEFDDKGAPVEVEKAVSALAQAKPYLRAQGSGGSPTNPPRGAMLTREAISKMTPEQINASWPAVQAALEKGI